MPEKVLGSIESGSLNEIASIQAAIPGGLVVRIRRSHRRGRGSIPRLGRQALFAIFTTFLNSCCNAVIRMCTVEANIVSIGGSVVEYSPATRVARVRFPADARIYFICVDNIGPLFPINMRNESSTHIGSRY